MYSTLSEATILLVDDEPIVGQLLSDILRPDYRLQVAKNGRRALQIARQSSLDLILLDVAMPEMNGFEVCSALKSDPRTSAVPVIFVSGLCDQQQQALAFLHGGVDFIAKPFNPVVVKAAITSQLVISGKQRHPELLLPDHPVKVDEAGLEVIRQLGRAAELRDNETGLHVVRVSDYAYHIALAAGLSEGRANLIRTVAPLHDIGKIGVPDRVLLKPGPLDADEWRIIRTHCELGYRIIGSEGEIMQTAALCAYAHHERWDGLGYPRQLAGETIPLVARILAVADVFDALTCARPYKPAWSIQAAVQEILRGVGSQFDPALVTAFLAALAEIELVMRKYP
jgi:putative two-component system response regulator